MIQAPDRLKQQQIFLQISDDIEWARAHFYPRVKARFNVYLIGSGAPESLHSIGVDLAIMSRAKCYKTFYARSLQMSEMS